MIYNNKVEERMESGQGLWFHNGVTREGSTEGVIFKQRPKESEGVRCELSEERTF